MSLFAEDLKQVMEPSLPKYSEIALSSGVVSLRSMRTTIVAMMSERILPLTVRSVHFLSGSKSRYSLEVLKTVSIFVRP